MMWKAVIERTSNGYYARFTDEETEKVLAYAEKEGTDEFKSEAECFTELAWDLAEFFAVFNNKHNKYRLNIEVTEQKQE
jgi:hypothetical protein